MMPVHLYDLFDERNDKNNIIITCRSRIYRVNKMVSPTEGYCLILSLAASVMETLKVVLTFKPVDEILRCDHSKDSSSAVLSHGLFIFKYFTK